MRMEDRLAGIVAFVHAADAGSFAQAAERLGQTRSAVAKAIARLEHRLGVRLFHRTTRRLALTEDGQGFHEHCRRALDAIAVAEDTLSAGKREAVGRLRVTAPLAFGRECVAPLLATLLETHARLDVEIDFADRVVDLAAEGLDLAVRIGRLPDSSSLAARTLGVQRFAFYAAPGYLARNGRPQSAADFGAHRFIAYAARAGVEPWRMLDASGETHLLPVRARLSFDDLHAIADAAVAGQGVARLPRWLARARLERGELAWLADAPAGAHATVHAAWPAARHLPMRTRIAIDTLVAGTPQFLDA